MFYKCFAMILCWLILFEGFKIKLIEWQWFKTHKIKKLIFGVQKIFYSIYNYILYIPPALLNNRLMISAGQ